MNTFDSREFPELTRNIFKMEKNSNEDLDLPDMSTDPKISNPHESCPYVREENNKSPPGLDVSAEVKSRSHSPAESPAREFPEPNRNLLKMEKNANEDVDLPDMSTEAKVLNPHESGPYIREENKSPIGLTVSAQAKSRRESPATSPVRPPHVILNEIDQSLWIDLGEGWRFQVKSNLKQIHNTKMIFAMFDHKSFEHKNVSEEIPHARRGTFHVSYYLRNLNSDNEETDIHATYAYKNSKTKNNEKRHYGPRFNEKTKKKTFKHTGKPYCLRELLDLFHQTRPDQKDIFIDYINDLKLSVASAPRSRDSWPMHRRSNRTGKRTSRR